MSAKAGARRNNQDISPVPGPTPPNGAAAATATATATATAAAQASQSPTQSPIQNPTQSPTQNSTQMANLAVPTTQSSNEEMTAFFGITPLSRVTEVILSFVIIALHPSRQFFRGAMVSVGNQPATAVNGDPTNPMLIQSCPTTLQSALTFGKDFDPSAFPVHQWMVVRMKCRAVGLTEYWKSTDFQSSSFELMSVVMDVDRAKEWLHAQTLRPKVGSCALLPDNALVTMSVGSGRFGGFRLPHEFQRRIPEPVDRLAWAKTHDKNASGFKPGFDFGNAAQGSVLQVRNGLVLLLKELRDPRPGDDRAKNESLSMQIFDSGVPPVIQGQGNALAAAAAAAAAAPAARPALNLGADDDDDDATTGAQ
jgi:hypothetical protein